jgi:hypothetical protein
MWRNWHTKSHRNCYLRKTTKKQVDTGHFKKWDAGLKPGPNQPMSCLYKHDYGDSGSSTPHCPSGSGRMVTVSWPSIKAGVRMVKWMIRHPLWTTIKMIILNCAVIWFQVKTIEWNIISLESLQLGKYVLDLWQLNDHLAQVGTSIGENTKGNVTTRDLRILPFNFLFALFGKK